MYFDNLDDYEAERACDYCSAIRRETGVLHCPIHYPPPGAPPIAGVADPEFEPRLDAQRVTLEFATKSTRRLDTGRRPITESPLFGGPAQRELF
jgi:hypothetical protein